MEDILKIKNKIAITALMVLIFLSCLSCVYAEDLNNTDDKLSLDSTELENLETSHIENENVTILSSEPESNEHSQAYLVLDNDADKENICIGDYVTWTVSVINKGPDTAENVKVYDQLPDGLKYIKHTTTKGTFNPKTGIWDIGNLTISDGEVFLNIITQAVSVGEKINKATLTSDTYNLNSNESYEEEEIDVFEREIQTVTKKSIDSKYSAGNPIALILISFFTIFITSVKSK